MTTCAPPRISAPRSVMRSTAPGPAPTRKTFPLASAIEEFARAARDHLRAELFAKVRGGWGICRRDTFGDFVGEITRAIDTEKNRAHQEVVVGIGRLDADRGDARSMNRGEERALGRSLALGLRMIQRFDRALDVI